MPQMTAAPAEKKKDDRYRARLSIPAADAQCIAWIKAQADLSSSVRALIRESIKAHGIVDVDCLPVETGTGAPARRPVGRPRKQAVTETVPHAEGPQVLKETGGGMDADAEQL